MGLTLVAVLGVVPVSNAQILADRIASASDRSVQFSYKARPGVCGDGRTYISTGPGNFYGFHASGLISSGNACRVLLIFGIDHARTYG